MSKIKVFISYAREDSNYVYELSRHLTGLIRNGLIEAWTDLGTLPGSEPDTEIRAQLEAADIIIFLISPDFIYSDYIHDVEIKKSIERYDKGEIQIVPIIVRPCDFNSFFFKKFQALPQNAKAISTWDDKDEAWSNILEGLKRVINGFDKNELGQYVNTAKKVEKINFPERFVDKLITLIDKGNIETAIKELLATTKDSNKEIYNSAIMLWSRLSSNNRNFNDSLISYEQSELTKNQIKKTLLSILNSSNQYVK